jgi:hypothetical protein
MLLIETIIASIDALNRDFTRARAEVLTSGVLQECDHVFEERAEASLISWRRRTSVQAAICQFRRRILALAAPVA